MCVCLFNKGVIPKAIIAILLVFVLASAFISRNAFSCPEIPSFDMLQPGDILFVDLYKGWCYGGYWDHVAIYVGEQPLTGPTVVEATYDMGVCLTPLHLFFERDKPAQIAAKRLEDMPLRQDIIQRAIDYALSQEGKPFDRSGLTPLSLKITEGKQHCSELVWRAYKAAGVDLDSNDGLRLYPDDIYYSPKLKLV